MPNGEANRYVDWAHARGIKVKIHSGGVSRSGVSQVAGHITPVPGGVGPMTITMLLVNTLEAAERDAAQRGLA